MSLEDDDSPDLVLPARGKLALRSPPALSSPTALAAPSQAIKAVAHRSAPWLQGVYRAFRSALWVVGVAAIWSLLAGAGVLADIVADGITLTLSALIFILSCPLVLFFRLDSLIESWTSGYEPEVAFLFMLPFLVANFVVIGACAGFRRGLMIGAKNPGETRGRNSD